VTSPTSSEAADAETVAVDETAPPGNEVDRLRTEVSALRAKLDTRQRRANAVRSLRRVTAAVLVVITAFALVASVIGVWSARTVLNTDRWVATVAPLPSDPKVASAVAEYATTQLFGVLDVEDRLREVLPEQAAFAAGPIAGQIRNTVRDTIYKLVQSDRFQQIWTEATRRAHQRALAIIEGTSTIVVARDDRVEIDLLPLINQVLRELSTSLPTLFGKQISLPDLSSGEIPANLRARIEDAVGVTLPANFAQFTVYDSGQLQAIQDAVERAKRDLVLFVVATFVLLILALLVSPGRRRTVLQLGIWLIIAAVAITAVLRRVREQVLAEVPAGTYRDAVDSVLTTVFAGLRERGTQLLWIGGILAVVAYLVGPGRVPVWLRRQVTRGASAAGRGTGRGTRVAVARGPGWIARHLDAVRIGGLVVGAVLVLILSSWTSLLVIVLVLAAFEVLVTLVARSAARSAAPADATAVVLTRAG
jgi:hypothetical protein